MADIEGTAAVEAAVGRWSPWDLARVVALSLSTDPVEDWTVLVLDALWQRRDMGGAGWPDPRGRWFRVSLEFAGVRNLRLRCEGLPLSIMGFEIHDVSSRGASEVRFQVEDYEGDRIGFECRGVAVRSVTPADGAASAGSLL
jgi:hypothetical protein